MNIKIQHLNYHFFWISFTVRDFGGKHSLPMYPQSHAQQVSTPTPTHVSFRWICHNLYSG